MAWGIFKLYDWIKAWTLPRWLALFLKRLLDSVVVPLFKELGDDMIDFLKHQIIVQADNDLPGQEKILNVINAFRETYMTVQITDRMLRRAIELLIGLLEAQRLI